MKIRIDNEQLTDAAKIAIKSALDDVNGGAKAFTVCNASDVYAISRRAERYLADEQVPKSDRTGATVTFRPAGPIAGAYKYAAISTDVTLTRTGSGWYLTEVKPAKVYPRNPERFSVTITDRAIDNLVRRTLKAFGRVPEAVGQSVAA